MTPGESVAKRRGRVEGFRRAVAEAVEQVDEPGAEEESEEPWRESPGAVNIGGKRPSPAQRDQGGVEAEKGREQQQSCYFCTDEKSPEFGTPSARLRKMSPLPAENCFIPGPFAC